MNKHEHAAQLAAARTEVERLMAIVPEPERPGMVLPLKHEPNGFGWYLRDEMVRMVDEDQYKSYTDAFLTLLLMRAQKGIVNPVEYVHWYIGVGCGKADIRCCGARSVNLHVSMFPCFATEADARAAIAAVGEDRIIRCAKWLAGCV